MIYDSQWGFIYCGFDPDSQSRLQELISPVGVDQENALVLFVHQYGLSVWGLWLVLLVSRLVVDEIIPTLSQVGILIQTSRDV